MDDEKTRAISTALELASVLDPTSRYLPELVELIEHTPEAQQLRMLRTESRAAHLIPPEYLSHFSLTQFVELSLVTPETAWMRFSRDEDAVLQKLLAQLPSHGVIVSLPCSTGLEVLSLLTLVLEARREPDLRIVGLDKNPELYESIAAGRIPPTLFAAMPGRCRAILAPAGASTVRAELLKGVCFQPIDIRTLTPATALTADLLLCRNLLGFFVPEVQVTILQNCLSLIGPQTVLMFDEYAISSPKGRAVREWLHTGGFRAMQESGTIFLRPS